METWKDLLSRLAQGGFGYFWVKHPSGACKTIWWSGDKLPELPAEGSVYFGVNPAKARRGIKDRATNEDIAQVNTLYAEFDAKDFGQDKDKALQHVQALPLAPSVLIDSGGGYHAYWLLAEGVKIRDEKERRRIADIQARWVKFVQGDHAVYDLARVLRVPGTYNYKYDPPREVRYIERDLDAPYYLEDLAQLLPKVEPPSEKPSGGNGQHAPVIVRTTSKGESLANWISKALAREQAHMDPSQGHSAIWLGAQLRDDGFSQIDAEEAMFEFVRQIPQLDPEKPWTFADAKRMARTVFRRPAREPAKNLSRAEPVRSNGNGHHAQTVAEIATEDPEPPEEPPLPEEWLTAPPMQPVETTAAPSVETPRQKPAEPAPVEQLPKLVHLEMERILDCFNNAEVGDADLFTDLFRDHVAYDHTEKRWYVWRGNYWERDRTGYVYHLVSRRVGPQYLFASGKVMADGDKDKAKKLAELASKLHTKSRMENVLDLASKNFGMGLTGEEWDKNPWLLGCPNGTLDLKTGKLRPGKPRDYIRSKTATEWVDLYTQSPAWDAFMLQVFGDQYTVVSFMARMLGYGITGLSVEHLFPILWGEGGNGKGTMLETLAKVLGPEITSPSQSEALMDAGRPGGGPQPFLYDLRGKRLVWASESKEGRRIDEGLVKQLTGGDRLKVRTLYTEAVEFDPTHLIMLLTNHRPHINADGRAIWRRVVLIPFEQYFVKEPSKPNEHKIDAFLKDKLLKEAPGILAWLVRGCLEWQDRGLDAPPEIVAATASYREEEDVIGHFMAERCVIREFVSIKSSLLYSAYKTWCMDNGLKEMSVVAFGSRMRKRFTAKESHGIWYDGITLQD
jgi:putative DNA primase/helicase